MLEIISVIVSIVCAGGSFISFLLAQKEKREAKESEAQAKIYAENANKANLAAEKFYAEFSNNLEHQRDVQKEQELKEKIITFIALNAPVKTAPIAQHIGLSKEEAFDILHSMSQVDHSIHCASPVYAPLSSKYMFSAPT